MTHHRDRKTKQRSVIETIWGTTIGGIAIMAAMLPAPFSFYGIVTILAGAAASTIFISKNQNQTVLENAELKRELQEVKQLIAELQISSADDALKKRIDRLSGTLAKIEEE